MGLKTEQQDDTQFIRIEGELDALEVQQIRPDLETALQSDASLYIVDVGALSMVDSSGIGLLVYLYKQARARSHPLALVGLQGQPADMISFLKIDQIVPTYATLDAARAALAGGAPT